MTVIVKEVSSSELPADWQGEIGTVTNVRVTIETLETPAEADSRPSIQELLDRIKPSKLKDGWDAVSLIRHVREERTKRILGQ